MSVLLCGIGSTKSAASSYVITDVHY